MRPVIICTAHKGVFFGHTDKSAQDIVDSQTVSLTGAKMAIYWGTTRGVLQLAATGPTLTSRISLPADITLNAVTSVFEVTDAAAVVWAAA